MIDSLSLPPFTLLFISLSWQLMVLAVAQLLVLYLRMTAAGKVEHRTLCIPVLPL